MSLYASGIAQERPPDQASTSSMTPLKPTRATRRDRHRGSCLDHPDVLALLTDQDATSRWPRYFTSMRVTQWTTPVSGVSRYSGGSRERMLAYWLSARAAIKFLCNI